MSSAYSSSIPRERRNRGRGHGPFSGATAYGLLEPRKMLAGIALDHVTGTLHLVGGPERDVAIVQTTSTGMIRATLSGSRPAGVCN